MKASLAIGNKVEWHSGRLGKLFRGTIRSFGATCFGQIGVANVELGNTTIIRAVACYRLRDPGWYRAQKNRR